MNRFSPEDDKLLLSLYEKYPNNWKSIADKMNRSMRQVRSRYLSIVPELPWTKEEERLLANKVQEFGREWSQISQFFPDRKISSVQSHWGCMLIQGKTKVESIPSPRSESLNVKVEKSSPQLHEIKQSDTKIQGETSSQISQISQISQKNYSELSSKTFQFIANHLISHVGSYAFENSVGSFNSFLKAQHTITNSTVAIKMIPKFLLKSNSEVTKFESELSLLQKLNHPFIAQFYEHCEDKSFHYLFMEYVENWNLLEYIKQKGRLSEGRARHYFEEIIYVLDYLYKDQKVEQIDIPFEKLLLDSNYNIKFIDLGISKLFSHIKSILSSEYKSSLFKAPEIIKGETNTELSNIWSVGILLYVITVGYFPFQDENNKNDLLLKKILNTEPEYPKFLSPPLVDLLSKLLCKDPSNRITLEKIKEHTWFSITEFNAIKENSINYFNSEINPGEKVVIDHDIIEQMSEKYNIDTHSLHQSLLTEQFNNLTAIYYILAREKLLRNMKNVIATIPEDSQNDQITNKKQDEIKKDEIKKDENEKDENKKDENKQNENKQNENKQNEIQKDEIKKDENQQIQLPRYKIFNHPKGFLKDGMTKVIILNLNLRAQGRRFSRPEAVRKFIVPPKPEHFFEQP